MTWIDLKTSSRIESKRFWYAATLVCVVQQMCFGISPVPWIIKLDLTGILTGNEVLKFSKPKFRKLPNKHTSFTNFSPSGLVADFFPAKKSGENSLERLVSLQRNDEQRETCSLLLLHRRKLTDFKAFGTHPVVKIWSQVAKGKSHSNYTTRFFKPCSKAEKHHLFIVNFQVGFLFC